MHFLNPCIDLTVYIVTTCTARNFCDGKTCSFAFTALSEIFWNRQYMIRRAGRTGYPEWQFWYPEYQSDCAGKPDNRSGLRTLDFCHGQ